MRSVFRLSTRCLLWGALLVSGVGYGESADEGPKWHLDQARRLIRATDFDQAWQHLVQARQQLERDAEGQIEQRVRQWIITADYYASSGGGEQIFQSLDKARELARQFQYPQGEAAALKQSAQYLAGRQKFSAAWVALESAREIYRKHDNQERLLELEAFASLLASRQGDHQKAADLAAAAITGLTTAGDDRMAMNALSVLAYSQHQLGRNEQALHSYQSLIPKAWALNDQLQLNGAYCNLAQVKRDLGIATEVESDLRQTVNALAKARHELPRTPQQRSAFVEQQMLAYSRLASLLVDNYRDEEALDVLAQFRGQAYLDNLSMVEVSQQDDLPPAIRRQEQQLLDALAAARLAADGQAQAEVTSGGGTRAADLEARLQNLRADYWQQHGHNLQQLPAVDRDIIQTLLTVDEAVLNYWQLPDRLLVWVITAEGTDFTNIPLDAPSLDRVVADYIAPFKWPWLARDQALSGLEQGHQKLGQKLYRWLVKSLPASAASKARWIIIPHGVLNELPWSALIEQCQSNTPDPEVVHSAYAQCRYLIEQHSLRYSSSLNAFQHLRVRARDKTVNNRGRPPTLLGMSPGADQFAAAGLTALPAAAEEVGRLGKWFDQQTVLAGSAANESRFKAEAAEHDVIHLATHGLMTEAHPLSSAVMLAADEADDGLLQAHEVLSLKLDARLVTLASCRSAGGRISPAEGLIGLSQAFLYAGADAVLASLWDVQDERSAELIWPFYERRQAELSDDLALQAAIKQVLKQQGDMLWVTTNRPTALAHPRFWAGYRLMGAP